MAIKLTLTDISSGYQGTDIQANFTAIEDEFDKVVYRDGSLAMSGNLDMNSQRLVNLPAPTSPTEPLRKDDQFTTSEAQAFATDAEAARDATDVIKTETEAVKAATEVVKTETEAVLAEFNDRYYGAEASNPSTSPSGDAPSEGDLFFHSGENVLKAFDGSTWINSSTQYLPNVDADITATEDELNILDGATVTTAELNILDGAVITTARLNDLGDSDNGAGRMVGEIFALQDNLTGVVAPSNSGASRYIVLTAGQDGVGQFNEGLLISESVSGTSPTITATAVIDYASSPIDGQTVRLINTEERFLRAGTTAGALQNSALEQHQHGVSHNANTGAREAEDPATHSGNDVTVGRDSNASVSVNNVSGASTDANETRPRNISVTYYMRIA